MSQSLLHAAFGAAQVMLALAMACAVARLMIGPRAQDRVLALDTLYVDAMLLILVFGMREGSDALLRGRARHRECSASCRRRRSPSSCCAAR